MDSPLQHAEGHEKSSPVSSLPTELWTIVGQNIYISRDLQSLESLIQVCRAFRTIFSPILYARRVITVEEDAGSTLQPRLENLPLTLSYTKELEVQIDTQRLYTSTHDLKDLIPFLRRVLSMAPNLESFRLYDNPHYSNRKCIMTGESGILETLKKLPRLTHLSLPFPRHVTRDQVGCREIFRDFGGFQHITSLELCDFQGETSRTAAREIALCLVSYPRLVTLGLGLASGIDCKREPEALFVDEERFAFLEMVCHEYKGLCNGTPLSLDTLRLGYGASLFPPIENKDGNYLNKLVRTSDLRTLEIFNGLLIPEDVLEGTKPMKVNFKLLEDCANLKRFCVTILEDDMKEWLNENGSSIQELIITRHSGVLPITDILSTNLHLPQLRILVVDEIHGPSPYALLSSPEVLLQDPLRASGNTREEIQNSIVDGAGLPMADASQHLLPNLPDVGALIGPNVTKQPSPFTILDRLENKGSTLTSLKLCIDFRIQWDQFSSRLNDLKSLSCLYLDTCYYGSHDFPAKVTSLWPGVKKPNEIAIRYADKVCRELCPSLRFIKIGHWAWKVVNSRVGADQIKTLIPMSQQEILGIELFGKYVNGTSALMQQPLISSSYSRWGAPEIWW